MRSHGKRVMVGAKMWEGEIVWDKGGFDFVIQVQEVYTS